MQHTILHETPWLSLRTVGFRDAQGREKSWSYVTRRQTRGAVAVVALTGGASPSLVLVRQFRPAVGTWVIEFPAGLLDEGESPEACALRELREESGYLGQVRRVGPAALTSAGLTDEELHLVEVEVSGRGAAAADDDEAIEAYLVPLGALRAHLESWTAAGDRLDVKLWAWALGRGLV